MDIDEKNYIYEMNPLYYGIRKYNSDGRLIKNFEVPSSLKGVRKIGDDYVILNGPFCLGQKFVLVQRGDKIDLYDPEGNYLSGNLSFSGKIRYTRANEMYVELWEEKRQTEGQANPAIICYWLK